tara:strand:+ start:1158 stop:1289 length:132 start_codon:yes stop_codon:yes gene_type:complete
MKIDIEKIDRIEIINHAKNDKPTPFNDFVDAYAAAYLGKNEKL